MLSGGRSARVIAPLAIAAGVVTELVVLGELDGQLAWARPLVIGGRRSLRRVAGGRALAAGARWRWSAVALAALFAAPATWAAETLGHATNGTFPTGGPASAATMGGGGPGFGAGAEAGRAGFAGPGAAARSDRRRALRASALSPAAGGFAGGGPERSRVASAAAPGGIRRRQPPRSRRRSRYAKAHGGGTIGVASQSSAASVILSSDANVAGTRRLLGPRELGHGDVARRGGPRRAPALGARRRRARGRGCPATRAPAARRR